MAETEIEPRVTTDERDKMQKVLDLISSDQMDKAASLLLWVRQQGFYAHRTMSAHFL